MSSKNNIAGIIFFGSMWGMLEATLGAILHITHLPYTGAVMFGIGALLMSTGLRVYKPENAVGFTLSMGLVASSIKGLNVLLPGEIMTFLVVLRPMMAIIIEALGYGLAASLMKQGFYAGNKTGAAAAALGSYLGYGGFALVFTYLHLGSNYWLDKTLAELSGIIAVEGSVSALFCVLTTLLGFRTAEAVRILQKRLENSMFFYPTLTLAVIGCWIVGALW